MFEDQPAENGTPGQHLREAAEALVDRYRTARASDTESAIAVLALWALDAIEAGRLNPPDADPIFLTLADERDKARDRAASGTILSDGVTYLLLDAMTFHSWGTEFAPDLRQMRKLALSTLRTAS